MGGELESIDGPSAQLLRGDVTARHARLRAKRFDEGMRPTVAIVDARSLTREGLVGVLTAADRFRVFAVSDHSDLLDGDADLRLDDGIILINLGANSKLNLGANSKRWVHVVPASRGGLRYRRGCASVSPRMR